MSTDLEYIYAEPSRLGRDSRGALLDLATSGGKSVSGDAAHPFFFSGFVEHPEVVAQALLVIARIARTRYYVPPNVVAAILRAADPVVTATAEGLRFESFSVCCGVYARLDVDASALDASRLEVGVTNVDVNPPLRQALAGLRASEPLHLNVGTDELRVATLDSEVVEEKVALPNRWLKGLAETQLLSAGMQQRHHLDAGATRAFVQALPRSSATKTVMWATPAVRGLRLATRPMADAVCVAGPERLRVLEPLLRYATGLTAYGPQSHAQSLPLASMWVLEVPGARISVGLSPEKSRGFSGEGAVLPALAGADATSDADLISALLAFEPRIDIERLTREADLSPERVRDALAVLASSGQVGYDVTAGAYFHRPLPVRTDLIAQLNPRLEDARALAAAVRHGDDGDGAEGVRIVHSGDVDYHVRLGATVADDRCTCPWYAKHRGGRGPCKHVLAARLAEQRHG